MLRCELKPVAMHSCPHKIEPCTTVFKFRTLDTKYYLDFKRVILNLNVGVQAAFLALKKTGAPSWPWHEFEISRITTKTITDLGIPWFREADTRCDEEGGWSLQVQLQGEGGGAAGDRELRLRHAYAGSRHHRHHLEGGDPVSEWVGVRGGR